jgi:hypothetical protein
MKKKQINLEKKLSFNKQTLTILTPDQQAVLAGGVAVTRTPACESRPVTGRPICMQCP